MVMLTELLRFHVRDVKGNSVPFADASIALLEDDYPPVTHVHFRHNGKLLETEWADVTEFDIPRRAITIPDIESANVADEERDVLLVRDLMDALVLDLQGRRTTRVCDLWLEEDKATLRLKGADAGFEALIRRVTRGLIGQHSKESLFDWKYVEFLRGDPDAIARGAGYRLRINRLPAGEIAQLAEYIPYLHTAELLKLLPDRKAADVFQALNVERQLQVIEELDEDEAVDLLGLMSPDLATDLLGRLHLDTMRRYITMLPAHRREQIIQLLRYPEDSVGGIMINDLLILPLKMNAGEARKAVSDRIAETEFVALVFVVDDEAERRLRGTLPLRGLLALDPKADLEAEMDPYLETLNPYEPASGAAYRIVGGQLDAMAVTNTHGQLIGAVTISAAVSLLMPNTNGAGRLRVFS